MFHRRSRETLFVDYTNSALKLHENAYYGHDWAFADYLGVARPRVIAGKVQHGWDWELPDTCRPVTTRRQTLRPLVWSSRLERQARARYGCGLAVGAPFLYLAHSAKRPSDTDFRREGEGRILYYPYHSWELDDWRVSAPGIAEFLSREFGSRVTVCLYYHDARDPQTTSAFREMGMEVIQHGKSKTDPSHLRNQLNALCSHKTVMSNSASTALMYAAFLGKEVGVVGPAAPIGHGSQVPRSPEARYVARRLRAGVSGREARALAEIELGADRVLPSHRLRNILGWSSLAQSVFALEGAGIRLAHLRGIRIRDR